MAVEIAPQISQEFIEPFLESTTSRVDDPYLYPVALANIGFIIDLRKYSRTTIDARRDAQDISKEPGEGSLNNQGLWRRVQKDWSYGAGQEYFDADDDDSRLRFYSSRGIDCHTRRRISLLHDVANRATSAQQLQSVLTVGSHLYRVDNDEIFWTADPSVASPTWGDANINMAEGSQGVQSITTDGQTVYAALGVNGIHKTKVVSGSSVTAALSAYQAQLVGYANGRLLATKDNEVVEVPSGGVVGTALFTHPNPDFRWTSIIGTPQGIFVAGNVGDRAEIYAFVVDETTGALGPAVFAGDVPAGEAIYTLFYYGQYVLIGTNKGFHLAPIESRQLQHGPLIAIPGGVRGFTAEGSYVWFTWSNFDFSYPIGPRQSATEATYTGLGRMDLSKFTATLVPVYATDLMAGTATVAVRGTVTSVATFGSKRYFAVQTVGVFGEASNLVATGKLVSSYVSYGTTEDKSAVNLKLKHDALLGTITALVVTDGPESTPLVTSTTQGTFEPPSPERVSVPSYENLQIVLTLTRSTTNLTTGPALRRWTLNSIVTPIRQDEILLPIWLKTRVNTSQGEGRSISQDTRELWDFLRQLVQTSEVVTYREGDTTENVYVDRIGLEAPSQWNITKAFYQGLVVVRLLTVD